MENSYEFNYYGGGVDEVYGLYDDENLYYSAPQETSVIGSDLFDYQTDFVYGPAFYVQPSYLVLYPEIPVIYSADYYYYQHVGVYTGYYVPYLLTNVSYVTDIYQVPAYETTWVSSSVEQNSFAYEEYDSGLYTPGNGFYSDSYESFEDVVGEATSTFHLYYEEGPETLNDDPNDEEVDSSSSSNSIVANDVVSTTPNINENTAVELTEEGQSSTANTNLCVEDDVTFLKSLSAADLMEIKADIDGTYNHLKENLYNDVTKGYTKMKEFLKNVKWKWDRCLYTIREEEKVKKSFDMDFEYYFHDVIRIPKGRVRYEDPAEKYILYQMLGSLEMPLLKEFMEMNYDNHKKRIYKKECKGHTKIKKQLKKLKWKRSKLYPITDGEELKITEKGFVKNFIRGLRNITSEKSKDVNYLVDVLKKSVLTSADMNEEIEEDVNEDGTPLDSELMIEYPQTSVFSSEKLENDVTNTPDMSISKGEHDVENEKVIEELQPVESTLCVPEYSKNDTVPDEIELSFCKEDSGTEKVEDIQTSTPSEEKIEENERPFAPPVIEMDSVSYDSFLEEDRSPVSVMKSIEEPLPDVPSSDRVEEMKIPPPAEILEQAASAAAAENCHQKKRFSSLRKFLSRICCCRKKPPS